MTPSIADRVSADESWATSGSASERNRSSRSTSTREMSSSALAAIRLALKRAVPKVKERIGVEGLRGVLALQAEALEDVGDDRQRSGGEFVRSRGRRHVRGDRVVAPEGATGRFTGRHQDVDRIGGERVAGAIEDVAEDLAPDQFDRRLDDLGAGLEVVVDRRRSDVQLLRELTDARVVALIEQPQRLRRDLRWFQVCVSSLSQACQMIISGVSVPIMRESLNLSP